MFLCFDGDYIIQHLPWDITDYTPCFARPLCEAVEDFVDVDKVEEAFALIGGSESGVRALALSNISSAMRRIYSVGWWCRLTPG